MVKYTFCDNIRVLVFVNNAFILNSKTVKVPDELNLLSKTSPTSVTGI